MVKSYWKTSFILAMLLVGFTVSPAAFAADKPASENDLQAMEAMGIDPASDTTPVKVSRPVTMTRAGGVLLIPESLSDTVGMYDPFDGTYLGDLIDNSNGLFSTPINVIQGPDGNLYLSDQVSDAVFVYDTSGTYLYTYADSSDGLDNIRGIAFRENHLFVTAHTGYVAEFDGPHSRLADFIFDATSSFFDIHFLPDDKCLVADIDNDVTRYYDEKGNLIKDLLITAFPEQIQSDLLTPGDYLVNVFTDKVVHDFELDGIIVQTTPHGMYGRGVYRLGNGNLLVTSSGGIQEIDPVTGTVIQTEMTGSGRFIELFSGGDALTIDNDTIQEGVGGIVNFTLGAGSASAGRNYILLGGITGSIPGTPLPGGMATLPVNWDLFTGIVIDLANTPVFANFIGTLNASGQAAAVFDTLGPIPGAAGLTMTFAFALNAPWDFASNPVEVKIVP